jgi:heme/copper-type cytochrome/quinol oxidase subunit 3
MIRFVASILTTGLIIAMTLGAMFILVRATEYVTSLESPIQRASAMGVEVLLGVLLLLATVWLATHLAVRIFAGKEAASEGGPVV